MNFTYDQPLVLTSGAPELKIVRQTRGTTTVELGDGRIVCLSLSVNTVKPNPTDPAALDINHSITVEIMAKPEFPMAEGPGTVQ